MDSTRTGRPSVRTTILAANKLADSIDAVLARPKPRPLNAEQCGELFHCKKQPRRRSTQILQDGNIIHIGMPRSTSKQ